MPIDENVLSRTRLQTIAWNILGRAAELGLTNTGYRIAYAGNLDANGSPSGLYGNGNLNNSGYSLSFLQWDFGARPSGVADLLAAYNLANPTSPLTQQQLAPLTLNGSGIRANSGALLPLNGVVIQQLNAFLATGPGTQYVKSLDTISFNGAPGILGLAPVADRLIASTMVQGLLLAGRDNDAEMVVAIGMKIHNQNPSALVTYELALRGSTLWSGLDAKNFVLTRYASAQIRHGAEGTYAGMELLHRLDASTSPLGLMYREAVGADPKLMDGLDGFGSARLLDALFRDPANALKLLTRSESLASGQSFTGGLLFQQRRGDSVSGFPYPFNAGITSDGKLFLIDGSKSSYVRQLNSATGIYEWRQGQSSGLITKTNKGWVVAAVDGDDILLAPDDLTAVNINGTEVFLKSEFSGNYAFTEDGDLLRFASQGNYGVGQVLTGLQPATYVLFVGGGEVADLRKVSFGSDRLFVENEPAQYTLTKTSASGVVRTVDVSPYFIQTDSGQIVGSRREETTVINNIQTATKITNSYVDSGGNRVTKVDSSRYDETTNELIDRRVIETTKAGDEILRERISDYDSVSGFLGSQLTTKTSTGSQVEVFNAGNVLIGKTVTTDVAWNQQTISVQNGSGQVFEFIKRQIMWDDDGPSYLDEVKNNITGEVKLVGYLKDPITGQILERNEVTLVSQAEATEQRLRDELFSGAASFLGAVRAKDKVGMLLAGAKMAADYSRTGTELTQFDSFLGGVSGVVGVLGALKGLQSGNALTQLNSAVNLVYSANTLYSSINNGTGFLLKGSKSLEVLGQIGAILSIANLADLGDMLDNGQYGSAAFATVNAINGAAFLSGATTAAGTTATASGAGAFIPMDPTTLAIWIVAVIVIDEMFAEDPPPPPPIGEAVFKRMADGSLGYEVLNAANGGAEILAAKMGELLTKLNQQVAQANDGNTDPDLALALIASRMPKITIQSWTSREGNGVSNFFFMLEQTHPQTGEKLHSGIARQDIVNHFAESLVLPEAIVSQWQVNHLTAKFGTDEANWQTEGRWLSALSPIEQQRYALQDGVAGANAVLEAAKQANLALGAWVAAGAVTGNVVQGAAADMGAVNAAQASLAAATAALALYESQHPSDPQLAAHIVDANITDPAARTAAIEAASRQWLKVIAIDLGDDGVSKIALPAVVKHDYDSLQTDGVARFDADNDGFREATEWIAPSEAMLGIDRDGNGLIDTASELFNGINTPFDQRGLASLKYSDGNNDGKIDATDPVYKLLRLWIDLNGDGSAGSMETYDLQMRHPGVDMAALRSRLDAAGQAAMDALANSAVVSIDLNTFKLSMADGLDAQASEVALQSHTQGIAVVVDPATQNVSILYENGLRENYITLVQDMSVLMELQNPNISNTRRSELEALALRYGLNTQSADFMNVVKSLRAGGENMGGSGMAIYIGDADVWVDQNVRQRLEQMRFSFHAANTVGDSDVFGTATLSPPVWAGASTDTPVFNDQWALSHHVTTGEVTSDTAVAGPPAPPNPEQWVLPSDVYTLDYVVKGAQLGGLVTQQAVIASNAATPGAPAQTIQVYTTATPTSSLAKATIAGREDEQFGFGFEQLEQEARTLIAGGTPYTTVRLLGVRAANHGYVEVDDVNGRIRFIADANYYGTDAGFSYAIMDGQGQVMERRINFNLAEVNDAPTVLGETIDAQEDVPLLLDAATLLANDTDLEGDTLTIIGIGRVGMGRAELLANGQISYRPPTDLYGVTDTIEYIVQDARGGSAVAVIKINLTAVDDAPTVVSEVIRNASEDTNLRMDAALLLANDFDPDFNAQAGAAPLTITAVGYAVHGQAFIDASGQIIFVPDDNFNGTATFEYTVTDDTGLSTTGKAEVEVGAVNDGPRAFGEVIASHEDEKLFIDPDLLLANDEDLDVQRGEQQRLMVVAVDQAVNGSVSLEGGHVVFTPTSNFSGEASFRYTVSDGAGGFSQAVAKVDMAAVNDAPSLVNRAFQGTEDTPINITLEQLLAGVLDAEDGTNGISFVEAKNAVGGTLERTGDTFTFTPGANFSGTAQFDYVVEDAQGAESTAVVTVSFNNVNDAPVFIAGSHLAKMGEEDQELRMSLSALKQMFLDLDGDAISVDTDNLTAINSGDTVRYDVPTQEIVFYAKPNANGTRQFDLRVLDSNGAYSAYQRLNVDIKALNDTPVVNAIGFEMLEDGGYNSPGLQAWSYLAYSSLKSGASDADGDFLSVLSAGNGRTVDGRIVSIVNDAANNRVGILAPLNYNGAFTFDFAIGDGQGGQTAQKAYGNVVGVNDLPTASTVLVHQSLTKNFYRLDLADIEDGSNVCVTIERHPLRGNLTQGVTGHDELLTRFWEGFNGTEMSQFWGIVEEAAPQNYFGVDVFSQSGDGLDSVTFRLTDSQGGYTFHAVNFWLTGYDPVVIDLDGDGLEFLDISESSVTWDRDGDGTTDHVAWIGASEGILAWDHNDDGLINRADEIEFWSHVNPQDPWRTDLQSLARPEFDTNQDGKFDSTDAKWTEFKLWRDLNSNGVSDAGELQALNEAGLKALHLNVNVLNRRYGEDVLVRGYTRAEMTDGRMLQAGDVQLGVEDATLPPAAAPTEAQQQVQLVSVAEVQALAAQQQQAQAAASLVGSPEFSGPLRDHKVLTGQSYRYVLPEVLFESVGAATQYSVMLASGQPLPAWLHFDAATRTLSGAPTHGQVGEWNVKVVGTGAGGLVSANVMTLSVAEFNQAPIEYGHVPTQYADEDQLFSLEIAPNFFIDKDAGDGLRFTATLADGSALPAWLHFDAQSMRFYGTPGGSHAGAFEVRLIASDEANATADTLFKIVVAATNDAPYLVGPVPTIGLTAGIANTFVLPLNLFADHDLGDSLQLSVTVADGSALPDWLTYDAATQTLSAAPTAEQISAPLQLRVSATDLAGATVATLMTAAAMTKGTDSEDVLTGTAYGEYIWGEAGNDTLDGLAGADRLIGGLGDDSYVVDALDLVVERSNEGVDTVYSVGNWTLGDNLENLTLIGAAAANATGNHLANVLSGNSSANTLVGAAGNDVYLFGFGSGQDTLVEILESGTSHDVVQFAGSVSVGDVWVSADTDYVYLNLVDGTDRLAIRRLAGGAIGIEEVRFSDGTSWDYAAVMSGIVPNPAPLSLAASHQRVGVEDELFEDASPGTWFSTDSPGMSYWARLTNGDALPAWLNVNAATGTLSGLPRNSDVATFNIRIYAKDTYGAVSSTLVNFSVINTNDAPTAGLLENQQAATSREFRYVLPSNTFTDVDAGDSLTLVATQSNGIPLPSWLLFDVATWTFSGVPPSNAAETVEISVKATDRSGVAVSSGFALDIGNTVGGSAAAETLTGTTGRDLLNGLAGNDILQGGAGNDVIDGGEGADTLYGGAGDDIYVVDSMGDAVVETTTTTTNVDQGHYSTTYVDQGHYSTTYVDQGYYSTTYIDQGYYRYVTGYDESGNPIYSSSQAYDESGSPLYVPNWVSVMVPQTTWVSNVVPVTTWVSNVVPVTTWVPNVVAQTTVADSGGTDTVKASVSYTLGTNQENLTLNGTAAIDGTGNVLNNVLTGNTASNVLIADAGADTLDGGAGDDVLIGGTDNDRYLFGRGYGLDRVMDQDTTASNVDVIIMQAGVLASEIVVTRTATQMVLTLAPSGDQLLIDWDVVNGKRIERVEFSDGTVWTANDLLLMSNRAPTFTTASDQSAAEDALWTYTLPVDAFADLDAGDTLSYSASLADGRALPGWLSFDAATRTFSGTPLNANVGGLALKVMVADAFGATASGIFNVTVSNTNDAPAVLTPLPNQQANETQGFSYVVPTATFGDVDIGDSLTLSVSLANGSALPSWLAFDATTRTLSGTPPDTAAGLLNLAVKATDTAGAYVLAGLLLDIGNTVNGTAAAETLTGTTGRDLLNGLAGNDILQGGAGNDVLEGGEGADTLYGGAGDDVYVVDSMADAVVEITTTTTYVDQGNYSTTYVDQGHYSTTYVDQGHYSTTYVDQGYYSTTYVDQGYWAYGESGAYWVSNVVGVSTWVSNVVAVTTWVSNVVPVTTWVSNVVPVTTWVPNVVAQTTVADSGGTDTVKASVSYTLGTNQENLTLNGTAAIDGTGNALNNVLMGNSASNVFSGGAGNDTYVLGRGSNVDTVRETDGSAGNKDVIQFEASIAADQIWFRQVDNDLEASVVGTSDKFIVANWYLGEKYRVEEFKTSDGGKTLLASQVQNLVSAMASFSPPAAGQSTVPAEYATALAPVMASSWN